MNLEYFYDNNNNIKYTTKTFFLFGLSIILISSVLGVSTGIDFDGIFWVTSAILIHFLLIWFVSLIIVTLKNNNQRKEFINIKDNGNYVEGTIVSAHRYANYANNHRYRRFQIFFNNSGEIVVYANNKTYTITNIAYNKDFRVLKQILNDNFDINRKAVIDLQEKFQNTGTFEAFQEKDITIGIYVLDNKVVADLNSIKIN